MNRLTGLWCDESGSDAANKPGRTPGMFAKVRFDAIVPGKESNRSPTWLVRATIKYNWTKTVTVSVSSISILLSLTPWLDQFSIGIP